MRAKQAKEMTSRARRASFVLAVGVSPRSTDVIAEPLSGGTPTNQEVIMKRILAIILAATVLAAIPAFAQKQFKVAQRVQLGGEGGWDYLVYDNVGHRLF